MLWGREACCGDLWDVLGICRFSWGSGTRFGVVRDIVEACGTMWEHTCALYLKSVPAG